jgi:hypothetical protein
LVCHAWQGGLHEVAVNCVEDEGQHDRTPLVGIWEAKCPLFQDVFVGLGKWFLGRTKKPGSVLDTHLMTEGMLKPVVVAEIC